MSMRHTLSCFLGCAVIACGAAEKDPEALDPSDAGTSDAGMTQTVPDAGMEEQTLDKFSFFVTSLAAMQALSGSQAGFGGDLRYGETGPGAGLRGADKICAAIAE